MIDYKSIYRERAHDYERLVSREDYQGNIQQALASVAPLDQAHIVELGAGTGRLTRLLAPRAASITACDRAAAMLNVATERLRASGLDNWNLVVADNARLPFAPAVADVALAGWSLGHAVGWHENRWRRVVARALAEMARVVRPGGSLIVLETLGTGRRTPRPPTAGLAALYRWWEETHNFNHRWVRTDYRFQSLDEAVILTRFFFGDELAEEVHSRGALELPECTGLWWRKVGDDG